MTVGGVRIATVTAMHSNGLDPDYIGGDLGKAMKEAGIAGDVGLPTGFVLRFSNGLVAYLSGDTGITADQELVVRNHYHAKLAVMNIGDGFTHRPRRGRLRHQRAREARFGDPPRTRTKSAPSAARFARAARPRPSSRPSRCRCTSRCRARRWSSTPGGNARRDAELARLLVNQSRSSEAARLEDSKSTQGTFSAKESGKWRKTCG